MDSPLLIVVIVALGAAAAAGGAMILRTSARQKERLERPPRVDRTDNHGRIRIIERFVYLGLELARVDGAIGEGEIAAIERSLSEGLPSVPPEEAARIVHNALRATIRQAQVGVALQEIVRYADAEYCAFVLEGLGEVAAADGEINRDERLFLDRVRQELG